MIVSARARSRVVIVSAHDLCFNRPVLTIRSPKMRSLDEEIARRLAEAAASGELSRAEGYGKPMVDDAGWNDTPEAAASASRRAISSSRLRILGLRIVSTGPLEHRSRALAMATRATRVRAQM